MSDLASTCCAPAGPVQSPASTSRSSMRTPSEVVVPTCFPAWTQDVGDQPGHGGLAVGPRDRDDRDAPLRVADPGRRSRAGRRDPLGPAGPEPLLGAGQLRGPRWRDVAVGEGDGRVGQDAGAFLPAPRERDDPVARVGRAMDRQAGTALAVIHAEPADPGHDRGDRIGPVAGRHDGAEPDQGVTAGIALAVPGPASADRQLHLDHRLQPVDVRSLEQADLDQSHGPGRIATRRPRRLAAMTSGTTATDLEIDALRGSIAADLPGLPRRPREARQHRLRDVHARRRERGRPLDRGLPVRSRGRDRHPARSGRAIREHGRGDVPRHGRTARGSC